MSTNTTFKARDIITLTDSDFVGLPENIMELTFEESTHHRLSTHDFAQKFCCKVSILSFSSWDEVMFNLEISKDTDGDFKFKFISIDESYRFTVIANTTQWSGFLRKFSPAIQRL